MRLHDIAVYEHSNKRWLSLELPAVLNGECLGIRAEYILPTLMGWLNCLSCCATTLWGSSPTLWNCNGSSVEPGLQP